MRESRRPPFFRVESLTSVMMSGTLFLFGSLEDGTYETNKTNVTLMGLMGMISNGNHYFNPPIAFYVQIQIF